MIVKTERFQLMLEPETMKAVDDWRFANRVPSRAEAMRKLISLGMEQDQSHHKTKEAEAAVTAPAL